MTAQVLPTGTDREQLIDLLSAVSQEITCAVNLDCWPKKSDGPYARIGNGVGLRVCEVYRYN